MRLVSLTPDALALIAGGGLLPLAAVRGWPHRDTLPLLWTAWQSGGPAWLVTADLTAGHAAAPGQEPEGPAATRPASAGLVAAGTPPGGPSHSGVVIGECAAKGPLIRGAPAEIGYGLAPSVRGRRHGRDMVRALVSMLVNASVLDIWAQTEAGNVASRRLLERAGFQLSGAGQDSSTLCYVLPAETTSTGSLATSPAFMTGIEGEHPAVALHGPDVT